MKKSLAFSLAFFIVMLISLFTLPGGKAYAAKCAYCMSNSHSLCTGSKAMAVVQELITTFIAVMVV